MINVDWKLIVAGSLVIGGLAAYYFREPKALPPPPFRGGRLVEVTISVNLSKAEREYSLSACEQLRPANQPAKRVAQVEEDCTDCTVQFEGEDDPELIAAQKTADSTYKACLDLTARLVQSARKNSLPGEDLCEIQKSTAMAAANEVARLTAPGSIAVPNQNRNVRWLQNLFTEARYCPLKKKL